jgi:hypothetical protein
MNTEKEVVWAVRNSVNNPMDVSVNNSVSWHVWGFVMNSMMNLVSISVKETVNDTIKEYEY